jgi:RNA polymerase sigma-70 factor (ECF subfamily)
MPARNGCASTAPEPRKRRFRAETALWRQDLLRPFDDCPVFLVRSHAMKPDQLLESTWKNLRGELRLFLVSQVGEPATADDLLQDVFLKLHRRAGDLQEKASPRAWLYRVARNAVIDHWRRRRETTEMTDDLAQAEAPPAESIPAKLAECLRPMIESLPAVYADALRLTELEEMPQAQAAHRLGLSLTALKSRVRRGRARLKEMLLQCCEFELSAAGRVLDYWPRQP